MCTEVSTYAAHHSIAEDLAAEHADHELNSGERKEKKVLEGYLEVSKILKDLAESQFTYQN